MNMEDLVSQEIPKTKKEEVPSDDNSKISNKSVEEKGEKEKDETCWHLGVCKWFNSSKGWGFLNTSDHDLESKEVDINMPTGDIFVHQAAIEKEGFRSIGMGEEVEFQAMSSEKGWEAVRVRGVNGKEILGMVREERKQKKVRCFNCGVVSTHLAADCPHPPLPKRCHHCKVGIDRM